MKHFGFKYITTAEGSRNFINSTIYFIEQFHKAKSKNNNELMEYYKDNLKRLSYVDMRFPDRNLENAFYNDIFRWQEECRKLVKDYEESKQNSEFLENNEFSISLVEDYFYIKSTNNTSKETQTEEIDAPLIAEGYNCGCAIF